MRDYVTDIRDRVTNYFKTGDENDVDGVLHKLHYSGDPAEKADLLLVGKDYESDEKMLEDFTYFMDFKGEHRGLFNIPPFNDYKDKFNVWAFNAGDSIGDWGEGGDDEGLVNDSRRVFEQVPFADYKAVLAKEGMGRGGFAHMHYEDGEWLGQCWVKGAREKREQDKGGAGLIHEVGHSILGLMDEYHVPPDWEWNTQPKTRVPNAAATREEAEELWGHLVDEYDDVGFYERTLGEDVSWKPHQETIMGGGLWSYGSVNELYARALFKHETWRDTRSRQFVDDLYRDKELRSFLGEEAERIKPEGEISP